MRQTNNGFGISRGFGGLSILLSNVAVGVFGVGVYGIKEGDPVTGTLMILAGLGLEVSAVVFQGQALANRGREAVDCINSIFFSNNESEPLINSQSKKEITTQSIQEVRSSFPKYS